MIVINFKLSIDIRMSFLAYYINIENYNIIMIY